MMRAKYMDEPSSRTKEAKKSAKKLFSGKEQGR
jgi:hypothetical protein